jgi:hypothetical protein
MTVVDKYDLYWASKLEGTFPTVADAKRFAEQVDRERGGTVRWEQDSHDPERYYGTRSIGSAPWRIKPTRMFEREPSPN